MEKLTITLKTITPMFLGGADGETPELRAPSVKGMMRFWWRAMNGHLSIDELRKKEGELFGSSDEKVGRSKFSLSVRKNDTIEVIQYQPLPHHTGNNSYPYLTKNPSCNRDGRCFKGNKPYAITPNQEFECIIRANTDTIKNKIEDIFKVSVILGGLDKRSRRGFGSIKIINKEEDKVAYSLASIYKLLNSVANSFKVNVDKIERNVLVYTDAATYPYIKEIKIGSGCKDYGDLLKVIGRASHENDCKYTGFALRQDRLASPIYVSIIKDGNDYKPIITRLHAAFKNPLTSKEEDHSDKFIYDILNNAGGCK